MRNFATCEGEKTVQLPDFQKIEKDIEKDVIGIVKSMIKIFKFNWIYSQRVSEKQEKMTAKYVKEYREEFWAKALKQANGDKDKAYKIYMNLYSI